KDRRRNEMQSLFTLRYNPPIPYSEKGALTMNPLTVLVLAIGVAPPGQPKPLEKAWYSPHESLAALAARDGIRWAMPETLAGRAWVGGDLSCEGALDEGCKQWGLVGTKANGFVVAHHGADLNQRQLSAALRGDARTAVTAAWELAWLRDARALPALAEALDAKDPAVALAAAQAIETLLTDIPLG